MSAFLDTLRIFRRALQLVWQSNRGWTSLSIALNLGQAALPLAIFYCTKLLIDQLSSGTGAIPLKPWSIWPYVLALGVLWLLSGLLSSWQQWVEELQQLRFTDQITGVIQAKSIQMDLAYYEDPQLQNTFHKAQYEAAYRPYQLLRAVYQLLQSGFFLLLAMFFLWQLAWWLVPVLLLAGTPVLLIKLRFAGRYYDLDRGRIKQEREAWYLHELMTTFTAARELRLFRFGPLFAERYQALRQSILGGKKNLLGRQARYDLIGQISEVLAMMALLVWVVVRAGAGALSIGSLVMYIQAFQRGQQQLRTALAALAQLYSHRLFLTYLFDFFDFKPRIEEIAQPVNLPAKLESGFQLEEVSFQYPDQSEPVLQNLNLEMHPGERVAIVGPNGSGKSTLIKLLARFYDPSSGRILLNGQDLRHLALDDLHQRLSIVFQDFNRYAFSAGDNIRISNLHHEFQDTRLHEAAQQSGAASSITKLPQGYDTLLGHTFEGGVELSGGQWQQIALARAFYADTEILILDEPSSAIDPLIEQSIFEQLFSAKPERLVIFVTHRLYHLQRADRILVMDKGQIVEQGSFSQLLAKQGLFAQLFASQQVYETL